MNASEKLAYTFAGFADRVAEIIMEQVERAVALERDRHEAELKELREDVAELGRQVAALYQPGGSGLHSIRS